MMKVVFPLNDVILREVETPRTVEAPIFSNGYWQLNQNEFSMQVKGVGRFYACNGKEIDYAPGEGATRASVELYLNGSVYGAILHQRDILPLHGSSFVWNEQGILLCGESGAGKSSLTAGFCFAGAEFLTDDVTPLVFKKDKPVIVPLSDRIKLWNDALQQLNQESNNLHAIYPGQEKYYFPIKNELHDFYPLHRIFILEIAEGSSIKVEKLKGVQLFTALRNEIYRWEYLAAMSKTEARHVDKLISIARSVDVFKVQRPAGIRIDEMIGFLKMHIDEITLHRDEVSPKIY